MRIERVQKNSCRNILRDKYEKYDSALEVIFINSLVKRREKLILAYGRKCFKLERTRELFPFNENIPTLKLRTRDKYIVTPANTERFKSSTVPYIQRMLNEKEKHNSH